MFYILLVLTGLRICREVYSEAFVLYKPTEIDNAKWTKYEIRRFTYKLGTINKQLRKIKLERNIMSKSFTVDESTLRMITSRKREISGRLQIVSRLRKLFIRYLKGLRNKSNPPVPYVPLAFRSNNVPSDFYQLGTVGKPSFKGTSNVREEAEQPVKKEEFNVLDVIAEVKGKRVYKGKLIDIPWNTRE